MLDIVQFDHISMAVPALDPQVALLERLFGFRLEGRFENDEGYVGAHMNIPGSSGVRWEVIAPSGPGSYLHRFLAGPAGPGLHHLAVLVRDAGQAAEALRAEGIEPWGYHEPEAEAADGGGFYIRASEDGNGVLYQLYAQEDRPLPEPFVDEDEHTIGVIAVNHVSHAHESRDGLGDWYERVFGLATIYESPGDGLETGFLTRVLEPESRQLRVETLQPATPASFVQRFLDRRGPGLHHVTFEVADWARAVAACEHHGVAIFGERFGETDGAPWREAFIHPRYTGGVLVQFFWQAVPGVWI